MKINKKYEGEDQKVKGGGGFLEKYMQPKNKFNYYVKLLKIVKDHCKKERKKENKIKGKRGMEQKWVKKGICEEIV